MDMHDGGQARRGKPEEQCTCPPGKHELHSVKIGSEDKWKILGINRTHGHHSMSLFVYLGHLDFA